METIKSSIEISELFSRGRRVHTPSITLIIGDKLAQDNTEETFQHDRSGRVAFIAGKKLGNAVWRNSAKRRMREICRDLGGPWPGYDVIFLAKSSVNRKSHTMILNECSNIIAGCFPSNGNPETLS